MAASVVIACEAEPIHVPGAIQPHGVLVAMDPETLKVTQVSNNSAELFGVAPNYLLGRSLEALIGATGDTLLSALALNNIANGEPLFAEVNGSTFDVRAHRHDGVAIVEFERQAEPGRRGRVPSSLAASRQFRIARGM